MDLNSFTPMLYGLLTNGAFWVFGIFFILVMLIVFLKLRQRRKFKIQTLIVTMLGNGKAGFTLTKSGWFKRSRKLKNLLEFGSETELVTKNWATIYGSTPEDYHDFNYKRLLLVTPSIDDPDVLIPVSKVFYDQHAKEMLLDFPPIEIREAAVDNYKKTVAEMKDFKEQIIQYIIVGMFFIVAFLTILFITQYGKHTVTAAKELSEEGIQANTQIAGQLGQIADKLKNLDNKPEPVSPNPYTPTPAP